MLNKSGKREIMGRTPRGLAVELCGIITPETRTQTSLRQLDGTMWRVFFGDQTEGDYPVGSLLNQTLSLEGYTKPGAENEHVLFVERVTPVLDEFYVRTIQALTSYSKAYIIQTLLHWDSLDEERNKKAEND